MKKGKFETITVHADNYIQTIAANKNSTQVGGTNFFLAWDGGAPGDVDMHSSSDFTIASVVEESTTTTDYSNMEEAVTRSFGANIYAGIGNLSGIIAQMRSLDSGSTWALVEIAITTGAHTCQLARVLDIVTINSTVWYMIVYEDAATDYFIGWINWNDAGAVTYTGVKLLGDHTVIPGDYDPTGDDYKYIIYAAADSKFYPETFDGTANPTKGSEITGLTAPAIWATFLQQYKRQGLYEVVITKDNFDFRKIGATSWRSLTASGTATAGFVWDFDENGNYIILFIIWKDSIIVFNRTGTIGIFEDSTFTDDAYAGFGDFFSEGTSIYQLNESYNFFARSALSIYGVEESPEGQIDGVVNGLGDLEHWIYDWEENLVSKLTLDADIDRHTSAALNNTMINQISKDLRRRVDIAEVASAKPDDYLRDYVFPLCEFIYEGTLDSTQAARKWPAMQGRTIKYILRDINLQYSQWNLFLPSYAMNWNDGSDPVPVDYKRKKVGNNITGIVDLGTSIDPVDLTSSPWSDSTVSPCTISIVHDHDGRKNVIKYDDQSITVTALNELSFTATATGNVSWSIDFSDKTTKAFFMVVADGVNTQGVSIKNDNGFIIYNDGADHNIVAHDTDKWYDFDIVFDTNDQWSIDITVDTVKTNYGPFDFRGAPTLIDRLIFNTASSDGFYQVYIDKISLPGSTFNPDSNRYNGAVMGINVMSTFVRTGNKYQIDTVQMRGKFVSGLQSTGEAVSSTPGSYDMIVDLPEEIVTNAMATEILTNQDQAQDIYTGMVSRNGYYQYGQQVWFAREIGDTPSLFYIIDSSYDAVKRKCDLTISKYLIIPKHESTQTLDNRQLISNTEGRVGRMDDTEDRAAHSYSAKTTTQDLDLLGDGLVDAGDTWAEFALIVRASVANTGNYAYIRLKGNSNGAQILRQYCPPTAGYFAQNNGRVSLNSSGVAQLVVSAAAGVVTCYISIMGHGK